MSNPAAAKTSPLRVRHVPWQTDLSYPAMSNEVDQHERIALTNRYVLEGQTPIIPVSGEIHYSRLPRSEWESRLRLMKAGGITVVATYVLWNHHEQAQGQPDFSGNLDVAAFIDLTAQVGLDLVLRIGPWCHGEVRNGGFPDWVQDAPVAHRTDDPAYLDMVQTWFTVLGAHLTGRFGPRSNVIGVQLENELYDQPEHFKTLKSLARDAGIWAPVWTATGWGGADLPVDDVLPLFGGYGDGFWVDADAPWDPTFRAHYFFSHVWDDPGIGADLREDGGAQNDATAQQANTGARTPTALYPAATCELGGGMATAYQRRPVPSGLDIAAVAHAKLGSGSAWQGYYMFAGGYNPHPLPGHPTLQESHATGYPNDVPSFDYDFHAPISAAGLATPSFTLLREQHMFLGAYGAALATMPSSLPEVQPVDPFDSTTLRWSLRSDGSAGILFVGWHQPHFPLETYQQAQFEVELDNQTLTLPAQPIDIPAGTLARWPINLRANRVVVPWITANLTTIVDSPSGQVVVVTANPDVPVEVALPAGSQVLGVPAGAQNLRSTAHGLDLSVVRFSPTEPTVLTIALPTAFTRILVLPAELAAETWVLPEGDSQQLVLATRQVVVTGEGQLNLTNYDGAVRAQAFDGDAGRFDRLDLNQTHIFERTRLVPALTRPAQPAQASYGRFSGRASAPDQTFIADHGARYEIEIPAGNSNQEAILEINWAGDVAQLSVAGRVITDRFYDSSSWRIKLSHLGVTAGQVLTLSILGLDKEAEVGLAAGAAARLADSPGQLLELDEVAIIYPARATT